MCIFGLELCDNLHNHTMFLEYGIRGRKYDTIFSVDGLLGAPCATPALQHKDMNGT